MPGLIVFQVREGFAIEFHGDLRERGMFCISVSPTQIQNGVREFSAFFLVESADAQENLRDDVLVEARFSGGGTAAYFQVTQRAELVMLPSFSAKPAQGKRYTVVFMVFCSSA